MKRVVFLPLLLSLAGCPAAEGAILLDEFLIEGPSSVDRQPVAWLWIVEAVEDEDEPDPMVAFLDSLGSDGGPTSLDAFPAEHATLELTLEGETVRVQSPAPIPCNGPTCDVSFRVAAGTYRIYLELKAEDHCGARGTLGLWREEGAARLSPGVPYDASLDIGHFGFDDDGDGVPNAFEVQACGMIAQQEGDATPSGCLDPQDPCCADARPAVEPGAAVYVSEIPDYAPQAVGGLGEPFVGAFYLDSTEVTYRQYARCIAAGACLSDEQSAAETGLDDEARQVRVAIRDALLSRVEAAYNADVTGPEGSPTTEGPMHPVRGIHPVDAAAYCAWAGKRLPEDLEWERAAVVRENGTYADFPWDAEESRSLGELTINDENVRCAAESPSSMSANVRIIGQDCADATLPVGSFETTALYRYGSTPAVSDMGGNVLEWTLGEDGEYYLRGGDFETEVYFARNSIRIPTSPDEAQSQTLVQRAGFRCAVGADDVTAPMVADGAVARVPAICEGSD